MFSAWFCLFHNCDYPATDKHFLFLFPQFFQALEERDVVYTTKASYQQRGSRVDCVMRTKISSDAKVVRMCMRSEINSPRLKP